VKLREKPKSVGTGWAFLFVLLILSIPCYSVCSDHYNEYVTKSNKYLTNSQITVFAISPKDGLVLMKVPSLMLNSIYLSRKKSSIWTKVIWHINQDIS